MENGNGSTMSPGVATAVSSSHSSIENGPVQEGQVLEQPNVISPEQDNVSRGGLAQIEVTGQIEEANELIEIAKVEGTDAALEKIAKEEDEPEEESLPRNFISMNDYKDKVKAEDDEEKKDIKSGKSEPQKKVSEEDNERVQLEAKIQALEQTAASLVHENQHLKGQLAEIQKINTEIAQALLAKANALMVIIEDVEDEKTKKNIMQIIAEMISTALTLVIAGEKKEEEKKPPMPEKKSKRITLVMPGANGKTEERVLEERVA